LSVLYVALTRAKYALHLILPPESRTQRHGAGIIREALALEDAKATDSRILQEWGNSLWFNMLDRDIEPMDEMTSAKDQQPATVEESTKDKSPGQADPGAPLFRPSPSGLGRNLARRSPSSLEGGNRVDLATTLRLDRAPALQRGNVVHAWCGKIEWSENWTGDDDTLRAIARATVPEIPDDRLAGLMTEFRGWMEAESVVEALSRDRFPTTAPQTGVRVEVEFPFVRRVRDEIQEGFIDRLVLIERDGKVVQAEILDFKTDAIEQGDDDTLSARIEHYRPQIEAYCDVVREQYGLAEADVAGRLAFLALGVVSELV
jgi:ATP-dependent exoDNAse (exonuclease V) beta subunit